MTGEKIKELRLKRNYTRYKLASKVGVVESTIKRWESEKTKPKKRNRARLYAALGVELPSRRKKSQEEREREKALRVEVLERLDAKTDDWRKLDDNDPDLIELRKLVGA